MDTRGKIEAPARHAMADEKPSYYVYILQSEKCPDRFYTGFTENLDQHLGAHNAGKCPHTSKCRPWHVKQSGFPRNACKS